MDDLISIRQAIEALKICDANYDGTNCDKCPLRDDRWNGAWWDDETDCHTKLMRDTAKLLETLSSQPERKKGKWVFNNGLKQFFCDQCGEPSLTYDDIYIYGMDFTNFCPNCGADMRYEQDQKEEKQKEKA